MDAPPVLPPERIDAMLSIMAEVCLEQVVEAGQRQKAADDFEAFDRGGRTLERACRNLRQTIALKQRFDREQVRKAEDGRRVAEADRKQAERAHADAVARKRARVEGHFERVLWDEYEDDDAQERFDELDARLDDLAEEPDFLETPIETLIQRLAGEIAEPDAEDEPLSTPASGPQKPPARPRVGGDPSRPSAGAVEPPHGSPPARGRAGDGEGPGAGDPFDAAPSDATLAVEADSAAAEAPPQTPERPPDPPPEPYIPPWERLRPGQRMPGGSGW